MSKFPEVHPEIKEFFEINGLKIEPRFVGPESEKNNSMLWDLIGEVPTGKGIVHTVGYTYPDGKEAQYYWPYTNSMMPESLILRFIRQKAFF